MLAEADGWVTKRGDCCGLSPKLRQQQQTRLINNDRQFFTKQTSEGLWLFKEMKDKSNTKKNVLISTLKEKEEKKILEYRFSAQRKKSSQRKKMLNNSKRRC